MLLTDCAKYQDWQTVAGAYAWRESGMSGAFTRVANCNEKDRASYPKAMLDYVDTHMAPEVMGYLCCVACFMEHIESLQAVACSSRATSVIAALA